MSEQIERLKDIINRLQEQVAWGLVHYEIWKSLNGALAQHRLNAAPWFFSATLWANFDLALLNVARLTDKHTDTVNIRHLLNKVEQMIGDRTFTPPNPKEVHGAIAKHRIQLDNLASKIESVRASRNKTIAHMDKRYASDPLKAYSDYGLNTPDVEILFSTLREIASYYAALFDDLPWDMEEPANQVRIEVDQVLSYVNTE